MPINISGTWKDITRSVININGVWKNITRGVINIAGTWRSILFGSPAISQQVEIEQTTGMDYVVTLIGYNYYWSNYSSATYKFQKSTNGGSTWSDIDSGSITNPSPGSYNTKQYVIPSLTPNLANLYRFSVTVTGTNGSTTTSTSSSTTVQAVRDITNLSSTSSTSSSVSLSWTAPQYAGSQLIQYHESSEVTPNWINFNTYSGATSSVTVTGLLSNRGYSFRILPYTGTSLQGYAGNYSNEVTEYTLLAVPGNMNITLDAFGLNGFNATWSASGATSYYIDVYRTSNGSSLTDNNGNSYPRITTSTSALFTGLDYSTSYRAYGYGRNAAGDGPAAFSSIFTTSADPRPAEFSWSLFASTVIPSHASNLSISSSSNQFTLSWSAGSNASNYTVYLSGPVNATVGTTSTSLTRSYTSSGTQSATVEAYNSNTRATISWGSVSGAASYTYSFALGGGVTQTFTTSDTSVNIFTFGNSIQVYYVIAHSGANGTGSSRTGNAPGTTNITPVAAYPQFGSNPSTSAFLTYTPPGVAPGVPGTPTLNFLSQTSTQWNYSATFFASTIGTTPINYYLRCYGSGYSYTGPGILRGPFSGTPGGNVSTGTFQLPKIYQGTTMSLWKVSAFAQNSFGTSGDSGLSNSA